MTGQQVAGVFGFYDEYADDSASSEAESYYEEYVEEQEVNMPLSMKPLGKLHPGVP